MKAAPIVVSAFLFLFAGLGADPKPDPREKLETAVPEAIRLLEEKEYVNFLKKFVPPADLKEITKQKTIDEFAKTFEAEKAENLMNVLTAIKDEKPKLNADKKEAVFDLKEEIDDKKSITFKKVGKYWYIQN